MKTLILATAVAAIALPGIALAAETLPTISDAYARSANPKSGAAFMTIHNPGGAECTLVGATSDVAEVTELHTNLEEGGVMKMVKLENGMKVPAGGDHTLARGGDHVMLMGLKAPLKDGDKVKLSLDFGSCGKVETEVTVDNQRKAPGADDAKMDPAMDHSAMGHGTPATAPKAN